MVAVCDDRGAGGRGYAGIRRAGDGLRQCLASGCRVDSCTVCRQSQGQCDVCEFGFDQWWCPGEAGPRRAVRLPSSGSEFLAKVTKCSQPEGAAVPLKGTNE